MVVGYRTKKTKGLIAAALNPMMDALIALFAGALVDALGAELYRDLQPFINWDEVDHDLYAVITIDQRTYRISFYRYKMLDGVWWWLEPEPKSALADPTRRSPTAKRRYATAHRSSELTAAVMNLY